MNYKLEKFWNKKIKKFWLLTKLWTINLKSFEINYGARSVEGNDVWTINLKSFEMEYEDTMFNRMS